MKCQRIQQKLSRYFDRGDALPVKLREHLQHCPECHEFWDHLAALASSLKELKPVTAPGDITVRVMAGIRSSRAARPMILRPAWVVGMATVLAVVVGFWLGKQWQTPATAETQAPTMVEAFTENSPGSLWSFESSNTQ